jgi:hypothetical protein
MHRNFAKARYLACRDKLKEKNDADFTHDGIGTADRLDGPTDYPWQGHFYSKICWCMIFLTRKHPIFQTAPGTSIAVPLNQHRFDLPDWRSGYLKSHGDMHEMGAEIGANLFG